MHDTHLQLFESTLPRSSKFIYERIVYLSNFDARILEARCHALYN